MEQDSDTWMDDGNVVLGAVVAGDRVQNTDLIPTMRLFRCHKSVLSKHSTIFRDMFVLAQSTETEQFDGVPLINLPDQAEDVKALLQVLYDPMHLIALERNTSNGPQDIKKRDFPAVDGIFRLAVKYEFAALHTHLAEVLRTWWPTTLLEWDKLVIEGLILGTLPDGKVDKRTLKHGRPDFVKFV